MALMRFVNCPIFQNENQQEITFTGTRIISSIPEAWIQPNLNVVRDLSWFSPYLIDSKKKKKKMIKSVKFSILKDEDLIWQHSNVLDRKSLFGFWHFT